MTDTTLDITTAAIAATYDDPKWSGLPVAEMDRALAAAVLDVATPIIEAELRARIKQRLHNMRFHPRQIARIIEEPSDE